MANCWGEICAQAGEVCVCVCIVGREAGCKGSEDGPCLAGGREGREGGGKEEKGRPTHVAPH